MKSNGDHPLVHIFRHPLVEIFKLSVFRAVIAFDLPNSHREYRAVCKIIGEAGRVVMGSGSCSTRERRCKKAHDKNPADVYEACLKMAKNRALVDALTKASGPVSWSR